MDDFATLQKHISSALVSTTRSAATLAAEDLPFHRSLSSAIGTQLDGQNARLLGLAERLLASATAHTENAVRRPAQPTSLREIEDVESNWGAVVDVVDSLLERADTALDEFTGAVRRLSPREQTPTRQSKPPTIANALRSQDLAKPQLLFENVPQNKETEPFKPLLLTKPHALAPLETDAGIGSDGQAAHFSHPYQQEIEEYAYPSSVYTQAEPIPYHPFESTTALFVDTEEALYKMLQELKKVKEIAIDLEHHDQRSYIGIVSLMQISTRDQDWIVDTLKPWRRKLNILNEVFADPSVVKVLHGAYMDIIWLQRDLGLYIVGLFDTHYAARALGYTGGSYAFLLRKFTGVEAQKQYQMADWRVRPLPQELIDYARSDTHYLLYVYDNMRNELIARSDFAVPNHERDKVNDVLERSRETALQRYEHPFYDYETGQGANGWHKLLARTPALFSREEFAVFRALHQWRDSVAREQDDSVHYVMPNHMLFTLARTMPTSKAELLGAVQPATQTVRLRADELAAVIGQAKEDGARNGPEMMDVLSKLEIPNSAKRAIERAKERSAASFEGVVKYLPKKEGQEPNGIAKLATSLPTLPLRTPSSMFWGSAFKTNDKPSRPSQQTRSISTVPDVQLTVPLPALTAEIFADPGSITAQPTTQASIPSPEPQRVHDAADDDDVFVLKEMGRKRQRAAKQADAVTPNNDAMATQTDEIALPDAETERLRGKQERKRARKEAKRAARSTAGAQEDALEEEAPFDYASAPSVLNPERPRMSREEARKERKKIVDPYKKSMDAPKGMARSHKERAGKTMTFKS